MYTEEGEFDCPVSTLKLYDQYVYVNIVLTRILKLGAQNWKLLNLWTSYFLRETTLYSDYNH